MQKKYMVRLTDAERETLNWLVKNKKRRVSAQKVRRAHVLLKADVDGPKRRLWRLCCRRNFANVAPCAKGGLASSLALR